MLPGGSNGESYFAPAGALECVALAGALECVALAGALECVAPAGGANWAAAQEGGGIDFVFMFCFFCGFSCSFFTDWFLRFLSGFSFF
jgi:hypothetical protein